MEYLVLHADGKTNFFDCLIDATKFVKSEVFNGVPQSDITLYKNIPYSINLTIEGYGGKY